MKGNRVTENIKQFILDEILRRDTTISDVELKLLKSQIRAKLAEMADTVEKMNDTTNAEQFESIMLTALSLKCILSLANRIERENPDEIV